MWRAHGSMSRSRRIELSQQACMQTVTWLHADAVMHLQSRLGGHGEQHSQLVPDSIAQLGSLATLQARMTWATSNGLHCSTSSYLLKLPIGNIILTNQSCLHCRALPALHLPTLLKRRHLQQPASV